VLQYTRSSAIAVTARVTIRSMIAVDRLILIVTLNRPMTYLNFISLTKSSIREILYPVMLRQLTLNCFKSRLDR